MEMTRSYDWVCKNNELGIYVVLLNKTYHEIKTYLENKYDREYGTKFFEWQIYVADEVVE